MSCDDVVCSAPRTHRDGRRHDPDKFAPKYRNIGWMRSSGFQKFHNTLKRRILAQDTR
jgi:hypothetical protein